MGSGVSIEEQSQKSNNQGTQNKIFSEEGIGIENSVLSRKWTQKPSLFRNFTKNYSEISIRPSQQPIPKLQQKASLVYSSEESDSDIQDSDNSYEQYRQKFLKKEEEVLEQEKCINPTSYKKITTFQSVSDESDIEERQLHNDRRISKHANRSFSDDSQQSPDEAAQRLKEQMLEILDEMSDRNTIDTQCDLQFAEQLELQQIMADTQQPPLSMPNKFLLKRLYMRSRLQAEKMAVGQEKKVRFDAKQEEFFEDDNQMMNDEEFPEYKPQDFLNQLGISITCKKGNKKEGSLKCDYMVYTDIYSKVIILTNGHGEFGQFVGNLSYRMIFHQLIHSPKFYTNPLKCLESIFRKFQSKLQKYIQKKKIEDTYNTLLSGCVLTVVIHRHQKLYFGHIGDNQVLIYKEHQLQGKPKLLCGHPVDPHVPSDPQEKARIFNSGGEVRKNQASEEFVYVRGRLYPQLHVTRSIGDTIAHAIGVSDQAQVKECEILPIDNFLVLSTKPSLQHLDDDEICALLQGFTLRNINKACESLYKQSKSNQITSDGVFDDMCVIMLWLGSLKYE